LDTNEPSPYVSNLLAQMHAWHDATQQAVDAIENWKRTLRQAENLGYTYTCPLRRRKHGGQWQAYRDVRTQWQAVRRGP
jgi:hypothetical protein